MTDTELFTLAGALLGCGGKTEATYVADLAFRRACEDRHESEPEPARQSADSSDRAPGQRADRRLLPVRLLLEHWGTARRTTAHHPTLSFVSDPTNGWSRPIAAVRSNRYQCRSRHYQPA
jgi:hypothetical protein